MPNQRISKRELDELLEVDFDENAKISFLKMSREEQLMSILGIQAYTRSKLASLEKRQIDFERDAHKYRDVRERREKEHNGHEIDNTEKIAAIVANKVKDAFAQRFDFWVYLRDRVAPQFITTAIYAIIILMGLYLSGKLP